MERINTILIIGRPGSGKGTQAKLVSERLSWIRLSSGDRIKEIRDGSEPFSTRVRDLYDKGTLLPDWFADYLLESSLLELDPYVGVICEGFARTENQAGHLWDIISWLGRNLLVINLEVSEDEAMKRMMSRSETQDRPDSNNVSKVQARLDLYEAETAPALAYLRKVGIVKDIDGEKTPTEIAAAIEALLDI